MPGQCLIQEYTQALSARLPARIVDELADGLTDTYNGFLDRGLCPDAAARAALAEFGEPRLVVAAFTRSSPARHVARLLLVSGPAVGACWAAVLVAGHAWDWPVPAAARVLLGMLLIAVIALLAVAVLVRRYRPARRAAIAACAGLAILDAVAVGAVLLSLRQVPWLAIPAVAASASRFAFVVRAMRPALRA